MDQIRKDWRPYQYCHHLDYHSTTLDQRTLRNVASAPYSPSDWSPHRSLASAAPDSGRARDSKAHYAAPPTDAPAAGAGCASGMDGVVRVFTVGGGCKAVRYDDGTTVEVRTPFLFVLLRLLSLP
ncbi:unnamed protein product [Angiostrongylus costaricensis]|uniref:Uncharacterized protein n=1 Tax=Angiostrongylus costaricensis TaxID=334426 RepID=A0A0R3PQK6_ANGCS|nr:unnamed protein product [Angiostrongylus costaricensis]